MKYRLFLVFLFFVGCNRKEFTNPNDPINFPEAPEIIYPTGDTLLYDNPPDTFRWSPIDSAKYPSGGVYEIMCAEESNFSNPLFDVVVEVPFCVPDELFKSHCFWKVRAKVKGASEEAWSGWSNIESFRERFPLVSEPIHPSFITSFTDSAVYNFYDMEKETDYIYFTCRDTNYYFLRIYSVSSPSSPQFAGACSLYHLWGYLAVSYPAAYVEQSYYIAIMDISDPSMANSYSFYTRKFCISGDTLFTYSSYDHNITLFDISALPLINKLSSFSAYYSIEEMCFSSNCLAARGYYGIRIFELNGAAEPVVGRVRPSFYTSCISANEGYLYLISSPDGMQIVKLCK